MRQGCTECTRTVSARRRNRLPSACRSGYGSPPPAASWWSAPPAGRPGRRIPGKCDTVPQPCRHCPCSWQSRCCPPACGTASRCPAPVPDCSACFARFPALPAPRSGRATPAPRRRMRPAALAGHRQSCPDPVPARRHPAGRSRQVLLPCGALRRSAPAGRQAGCARSAGRSPVTVPWRAGGGRCPVPAPSVRRYAPRRGRWRTACTDPQTPRPAPCTHRRRRPARRRPPTSGTGRCMCPR